MSTCPCGINLYSWSEAMLHSPQDTDYKKPMFNLAMILLPTKVLATNKISIILLYPLQFQHFANAYIDIDMYTHFLETKFAPPKIES